MRLTEDEVKIIKSAILQADPNARIFLFGSRIDDQKKGGDIDLLVFSTCLTFADKIKIKTTIYEKLEEQKIDIIIAKDELDPFVQLALEKAVSL